MTTVYVSGSFDDLRSPQMRFIHEASKMGNVHILLWSDLLVGTLEGREPRFPIKERIYVLDAVRYVNQLTVVNDLADSYVLPGHVALSGGVWAVDEAGDHPARKDFCQAHGLSYQVIGQDKLKGFPVHLSDSSIAAGKKKALVTGCYDWLHSGHVRFFEEVAQLGELYVVVGNDSNVRHLKGEGHPLFGQEERRYMVQSVRFVHEALISSGWGWMDAEAEIAQVRPDIYVVNEDGDKPEKRAFCREHGLKYVVLKRRPKDGLPRRESTHLRGF